MRKYDSYKDSGIEWIGEIPSHWEVKKVKHLTRLQGGYAFKSDLFTSEGIPVIRIGDIADSINFEECKKIDDDTIPQEYRLEQFDTLIALSGATTGKTCFIGNVPPKAYINQRVARILFSNKLLYYIINSGFFQEQILLTASGSAQENISNSQIENLEISISNSQKEQTAIANYLDHKIAEIDELIADKKRLLELYEEEKTAIINQAVTKGLPAEAVARAGINPDVPMKDSGIEWLGEIPEHWEVKRLSWCFGIIGSGTTPKAGNEEYYFNGEFNWLLTGDLTDGDIFQTSKKITQKALEDYSSLKKYPVNSVVIAMYGATIGKLGILKIPTTVNQACCVMANPLHLCYQFAFFILLAARKEIINMSYGGGQPNISQELIKAFRIPVPPLEEQHSIVRHIETECARIDAKKAKTEKLIELLTEYRTALISEVVTGKIKVID